MFVRFVVGTDADDHRDLTGVITETRILAEKGALEDYETAWLEEVYVWFNEHVPVPPFSKGKWPTSVVTWFKDTAQEPMKRIWDLIALLREHSVPVRMLRSNDPGFVYYEDDVQVVVDERRPSVATVTPSMQDACRAVVKRKLPHGRFKVLLDDGSELTCELAFSWDKANGVRVGDVLIVRRYDHVPGECFLVGGVIGPEDL